MSAVSVRGIEDVLSAAPAPVLSTAGQWVAGAFLPESDSRANGLDLVYPATGEVFGQVRDATATAVDQAVAAAQASFEAGVWSRLAVSARQQVLRDAAVLIVEHAEELAFLETLCAGLPIRHLRLRQVPRAAQNFGFFAEVIGQIAGETFDQQDGFLTSVTREPAGVAALLAPWNAPLALASMQVASCIAFGNSAVIKPSEHTPLATLRLVQLLEQAGLPPGVVNVINGSGQGAGQHLAGHAGIDRIAFTGGTSTARQVMASAARQLTPVHFELGGKSANMVFADADLERAVDGSLLNIFSNTGQICIAGSRILLQRPVADEFIGRFVSRTRALRIGDPTNADSELGPLAFEAHMQRVLEYMELARQEGGQVLCGGARDERFDRGWFVQPTVVQVGSNALRICQEEVFGPFVTIQVFDEVDEAIALANDSDYGLVAYGWTGSLPTSMRLQSEIRAGTVWINTPLVRDLHAPFGGFKQSGIGRDGPRQCADFFTEEKATIVPRREMPIVKMGMDHGPAD